MNRQRDDETLQLAIPSSESASVSVPDEMFSGSGRIPRSQADNLLSRGLGAWLSFRREKVPGTAPIAFQQANPRSSQ